MTWKEKRSDPPVLRFTTNCTAPWWKVGDGPMGPLEFFHHHPGGRLERHLGQAHRVLDLPQGWAFFRLIHLCQADLSDLTPVSCWSKEGQEGWKPACHNLTTPFFRSILGKWWYLVCKMAYQTDPESLLSFDIMNTCRWCVVEEIAMGKLLSLPESPESFD